MLCLFLHHSFSTSVKLSLTLNLSKMITYNSNKFNNLIKKILEIFKVHNINSFDSETLIPENILESISSELQNCVEPSYKFLTTKCPKCGKSHLNIFNSAYYRNIILKVNNILIKVKILIPRLKCENCKSTHAVLPDFCVPLKQYSKQAILEIASLASKQTTEVVANTLNIESKQVRRFINLVSSFINSLMLLFQIANYKKDAIKRNITQLHNFIGLLPQNITRLYFEHYKTIFLYVRLQRILYFEYSKL